MAGAKSTLYLSTDQNPYPSIDNTFYSTLENYSYGVKDENDRAEMSAWTRADELQRVSGYYHYDPTMATYGYGTGYEFATRRKNATRESTSTLKAWLNEHETNPYPTKSEKIMLAIITKMTLTQVSTWFANARRRLKKVNKITWKSKSKPDDDDLFDYDDKDKDDESDENDRTSDYRISNDDSVRLKSRRVENDNLEDDDNYEDENRLSKLVRHRYDNNRRILQPQPVNRHPQQQVRFVQDQLVKLLPKHNLVNNDNVTPLLSSKPKIWSLADTAVCTSSNSTPSPIMYTDQPSIWCTSSTPTATNTSSTYSYSYIDTVHKGFANLVSSTGSHSSTNIGGYSSESNFFVSSDTRAHTPNTVPNIAEYKIVKNS